MAESLEFIIDAGAAASPHAATVVAKARLAAGRPDLRLRTVASVRSGPDGGWTVRLAVAPREECPGPR